MRWPTPAFKHIVSRQENLWQENLGTGFSIFLPSPFLSIFAGCKLQPETRRFLIIADQEQIAGERERIPGLGVENSKASQFVGRRGSGAKKDEFSGFGHQQVEIAHEQTLPMAVTAFLPAQRTVLQIHAGENAVVESVEAVLARKEVGELCLHADGLPDQPRGEL